MPFVFNSKSVGFWAILLFWSCMRSDSMQILVFFPWIKLSQTDRFFPSWSLTLSRVKRLRSWSVPMLCMLALSWLMTVLAMLILNFCRPMIFSSSVPRVISRYTFTTRFCRTQRRREMLPECIRCVGQGPSANLISLGSFCIAGFRQEQPCHRIRGCSKAIFNNA